MNEKNVHAMLEIISHVSSIFTGGSFGLSPPPCLDVFLVPNPCLAHALPSRANFECSLLQNNPQTLNIQPVFPQEFERSLVEWEPAVGWPLQNGMWEGRGDVQVIHTIVVYHKKN
jgi:hypothetical protein